MEARVNTLLFDIDQDGPKVTPMTFQRWLRDDLLCSVNDICGIQQEFGTRRVYVKFTNGAKCDAIMGLTEGKGTIMTEDGSRVQVEITNCGYGYREVRIFNVPFEVRNDVLTAALAPYGKVINIRATAYGENFIFKCDSGVRIARMELRTHIPSFLHIGTSRTRATVVYDGQERTCAICNKPGHLRFDCPEKKSAQGRVNRWADVVSGINNRNNNHTVTEPDNTAEDTTKTGGQPSKQADAATPSGSAENHVEAPTASASARQVDNPNDTKGERETAARTTTAAIDWSSIIPGKDDNILQLTLEDSNDPAADDDMEFSSSEGDGEGKGFKRTADWEASASEKRRLRKSQRLKEKESGVKTARP
ncbi:uncharacterized protein LOC117654169 [Thrips palmi]|uniref:Uncharacterized protein LOC117654169 n=1 Tax=Thrips palmi TaxID=161013 RepID=A0A6P9AG04_THRPL|nr:uncharacterized protein LOC117654169 [Thrips palmi]